MNKIFIGYDPRESDAFAVTVHSIRKHYGALPRTGLVLDDLIEQGLYTRPMYTGRNWDVISNAPMSTEFAISRFLTPHLGKDGLALFMDCDMLVRRSLQPIFDLAMNHPDKAVWVVKHFHYPENTTKMDGCIQTQYERKNWSSVMLFNCDHPFCKALTPDVVNHASGLSLHQFRWLPDDCIGDLGVEWNYLVGHSACLDPAIVHFTEGVPSMARYEHVEYADEWRAVLRDWAKCA